VLFGQPKAKCERPQGEINEEVASLAACGAKAAQKGRTFFNFDEKRNLCFTSDSCDKPVKTKASWQIYTERQRPTPSPTSVTPSPTAAWVRIKKPKMKCEKPPGGIVKKVSDITACMNEAEYMGRPYFNFEPIRLECFTSVTCNKPKATGFNWNIYEHQRADEEPSPTPAIQWVKKFQPKRKCEKAKGDDPPKEAADADECQRRAEAEGRKFFNYESDKKLCFTSVTCKSPVRTNFIWQVYEQIEGPSSSEDDELMVQFSLSFEPLFDPHRKCERPEGEIPVTVATVLDCEALAHEQLRPYVVFDATRAELNCYTAPTCDEPLPSVFAWQILGWPLDAPEPPEPSCPSNLCLGGSGQVRLKMCEDARCASCPADLRAANCEEPAAPPESEGVLAMLEVPEVSEAL
jgi:hypothetical protein